MKYKVTLNAKTYEVEVEAGKAMLVDEYAAYAPAPAAQTAAPAPAPQSATAPPAAPNGTASGEPVKAPMPGNILKIHVAQGDAVKRGQVLLVLEAMKMENEIMAPRDGTVSQIVVSKGAQVETGADLLVLA